MISPTYRKIFLYGLALIGIVIMITMPDVVIGLLFESVHFFFELLFILFEWIESTLDKLVEHLFHTELHQTQIIVFYLLVVITVFPLYYLSRMLLRLFFRLKETLLSAWTLYKTRAALYWQDLSLIDKIKLIVITVGAIYLASFIFM
ncbi:MAG: hypothetical protein LUQ56_10695 [Methylococcaceae bacterium]|jgi:hypothetical protein|nr:hypothetical protein [Methylococcaceae bacterium]MDD1638579.1 hypothetical protein [Methylococcaceae bacterium]MDD1642615.1 hypothetical protein [Methylococcaceae bacterium]